MSGDDMTTAEIRQIRERLNLTQVEFAKELGVCQGTVSHWEKGIRTPTGPAVRLLRILASSRVAKKTAK
jgi:putative transcriptional regulator